MKKLLSIFLLLPLFTFAQTQVITGRKFITNNTNYPVVKPVVIISAGESNPGGEALNSALSSGQLGPYSNLLILNNNTFTFQPLHIGVNNNLDHVGLTDTTHGWELQIATMINANTYNYHAPVYYLQTGQGGSTIGQWSVGNATGYYATMLQRIDTMLAHVTNPQIFCFYSQGLNEASTDSANMAAWKTATIALFNQLRTDTGYQITFIIPEFSPPMNAGIFNTNFLEIAESMSGVYVVDTSSVTDADMIPGNFLHWADPGFVIVGMALMNEMLGQISLY